MTTIERTTKARNAGYKLPRLRAWRESRAMTQVDLARATGFSRAAISKVESGVGGAKTSTLRKIADALGITTADLLYGEPGVPQTPNSALHATAATADTATDERATA